MNKIIIIICLGVFICSGALIICYLIGTAGADLAFKDLKTASVLQGDSQEEEGGVDLEALCVKNQDVVGWVTVEGTRIDYPVMKTISDNEFYLHKDFNGDYSESGTPFMDAKSSSESSNWLIYGHNMKIGTMFHDLLEFDSREFWASHSTFSYTHFKEGGEDAKALKRDQVTETYRIMAAGYSQIYDKGNEAFKYYDFAAVKDKMTFEKYVEGIKAISCYDTGVDAEYGDSLITLSTCAYHTKNGRFFVVGVRM